MKNVNNNISISSAFQRRITCILFPAYNKKQGGGRNHPPLESEGGEVAQESEG